MSLRIRISPWRPPGWARALAVLGLLAVPAAAQRERLHPPRSVTLAPVRDNTLYQDPAGARSNGAGGQLFAGLTAAGEIRRAALAFDVASHVPAGARILGAELRLHVTRTISGPQTVGLHLALADWGEGTSNAFGEEGSGAPATAGDATWLHTYYPTGFWTTPGGDFAPAPSAARSVGFTGPHTWSSPGLAADVQAWVDDPASNHGWILVGAEPLAGNTTAKRFASSEGPLVLRPRLTIRYE